MTRQEHRNEYAAELGEAAERMIQAELSAITISLDGDRRAAVAMINQAVGLRIMGVERGELLKQQAIRISFARKEQIELEGINRG